MGDIPFLKSVEKEGMDGNWSDVDDQESEEEDNEAAMEWSENMTLAMPSTLGAEQCKILGLQALRNQEIELRIGQLNDCLENLRINLGHKIKTSIQNLKSQQTKTWAWADVGRVDKKIKKISRNYNQACDAILRLGASEVIFKNIRKLLPKI